MLVVRNGFYHASQPRSWELQRRSLVSNLKHLISDKMFNVWVLSQSRTHASQVSSRSWLERTRAHPWLFGVVWNSADWLSEWCYAGVVVSQWWPAVRLQSVWEAFHNIQQPDHSPTQSYRRKTLQVYRLRKILRPIRHTAQPQGDTSTKNKYVCSVDNNACCAKSKI